jgi:polyisoprenoid-binding protein YceI
MAMSAMQIVGGVEMPVAGTRSTDVTSVESGSTNRDDGLRSASWFDVDNHPTAQFRSTAITVDDNGGTSPATSPSWESRARWSSTTSSTSATPRSVGHRPRRVQHTRARINREDWGITNDMTPDSGGLLGSKRIQLELELIGQSRRHE